MKRVTGVWSLAMVWMLAAVFVASMPLVAEEGEEMSAGQELFLAQKCNMCHAVPTAGIEAKTKSDAMKGPDLVDVNQEADWIAQYLKKEVQMNDADHKKEFKGSDEELQTLISWLLDQKSGG